MSVRIAQHIRSNVVGYLALFVALSGTAYAIDGPLAGQNQVGSRRHHQRRGEERPTSATTR